MSYPKKSAKEDIGKGKKQEKTNQEKDKAYASQKRNQLQSLLEGKFKTKYSNEVKDAKIDQLITNEVSKFIATQKLTEPNLNKLDQHIASLISEKAKKQMPSKPSEPKKAADPTSQAAVKQSPEELKKDPSAPKDILCEDNWAQIVDYNKKLHDEEEKQKAAKKQEMKTKLKSELDKQIEEKKKLQENLKNKEQEEEAKQVKRETELEIMDKKKEIKQKEDLTKHKKEAKRIFESI